MSGEKCRNIIEIFENFETNLEAVEYLERVRWGGKPTCHYCQRLAGLAFTRARIGQLDDGSVMSVGGPLPLRWGRSFTDTCTRMVSHLALRSRRKSGVLEIARDLGMNRPTVGQSCTEYERQWMNRRNSLKPDENTTRKTNRRVSHPRGRGTSKTPITGVLERGGRVHA